MLGIEYSPCYHCDKTKCSFCELTRYKDSQQKKEASEMRLIDADALMRDIGETVIFSGKPGMVSAEMRGARKIIDRIRTAPTADVVEVVRARWEDEYGGAFENPRYRCSYCKGRALYRFEQGCLGGWHETQALADYCPNCGARMDGDTNEQA